MWKVVGFLLCALTVGFSSDALARKAALQLGVGQWYSDSFRASYVWGGGLLIQPLDWLAVSLTYDQAPVKVDASYPQFASLNGKSLGMMMLGLESPMTVQVGPLKCSLYPLLGYVSSHLDSNFTHGLVLGGGLEAFVWKEYISIRAEVRDQIYQVPYAGGNTDLQSDLFFIARVVVGI